MHAVLQTKIDLSLHKQCKRADRPGVKRLTVKQLAAGSRHVLAKDFQNFESFQY